MTEEQAKLDQRRDELLHTIDGEIKFSNRHAWRFELAIHATRWALWGSMIANFLVGVFSSQIPTKVLSPLLPILTSVAGGAYYFLGKMSWREKSNTYYNARDRLKGLERRLKFEQHTPTADSIAAISKDLGKILGDRGGRLSAANHLEDQNIGKGKPQTEG